MKQIVLVGEKADAVGRSVICFCNVVVRGTSEVRSVSDSGSGSGSGGIGGGGGAFCLRVNRLRHICLSWAMRCWCCSIGVVVVVMVVTGCCGGVVVLEFGEVVGVGGVEVVGVVVGIVGVVVDGDVGDVGDGVGGLYDGCAVTSSCACSAGWRRSPLF